ncbi:MAG: M56 family metallopeptidase [Desulfitobacteriaceae bacterium]
MLESVFKGVLNISFYATAVAVAIMFIKVGCGKRLSSSFHHGIWFVFLLKLVIPFDIKSVFSLFTLFNQVAPVPVLENVNTVLPPMTTSVLINPANHQPPILTTELAVPAHGLDLWNVAALIWVLGILVMFAVLLFSYIKTSRILKVTVEEPDDRWLALLEKCKSDLKMRIKASVYITRSFEIPFIFGFLKPVIILPERIYKNLTDERIIAILSHELMHIKRRDYVVNVILFLLKSVYWFNPVVWLSFAWLKNDGERACDSAVVKNYLTERRREYARALLDVASCVGKRRHVVAVSAFTEGNLKDRVKNVLTGRKYSYIASFAAIAVAIIAGTVLLTGALTKSEDISPGASITETQVESAEAITETQDESAEAITETQDESAEAITETQDESAVAEVISLVENFGQKLQAVSLLAPRDYVNKSIQENYGEFVSPELLSAWQKDLQNLPGRMGSSPWPDRIEILSTKKSSESEYEVKGKILEITSEEMQNGGVAGKRPINLSVGRVENRWLITAVQLGAYEDTKPKVYENLQYGFKFSLPESWQGNSIITATWEGLSMAGSQGENVVETGPLISIRHPQWTAQNQRQDIPIMIFTRAQWNSLQRGDFHIGAAPIGPSELARNSKYVFALPARYNYAFPTGFEEVENILKNTPLRAYEQISLAVTPEPVSKQADAAPSSGSIVVEEPREVIKDTLVVTKTVSAYAHGQHLIWVEGKFKSDSGELFIALMDKEGHYLNTGSFLQADEINPLDDGWLAFSHKLSEDTGTEVALNEGVLVFDLQKEGEKLHGELSIPLMK